MQEGPQAIRERVMETKGENYLLEPTYNYDMGYVIMRIVLPDFILFWKEINSWVGRQK